MKISFAILFFSVSTMVLSQDWTKDDRNNIYQDYLSLLIKYSEISQEQKATIALCAMNTTCEKYTRKEFFSKIEIEVERIQDAQLGLCAKNSGVDLYIQKTDAVIPVAEEKSEWTKEDKQFISREFSKFCQSYEMLTPEQIDKITICYLTETTSKMTKTEYQNLIDIELKEQRANQLNSCAKTLQIDLKHSTPVPITVSNSNKDLIIGTWKTDQGMTIVFNGNGTFVKKFTENNITSSTYYFIENQSTSGDWFMDAEGILTLVENYTFEDVGLFKINYYKQSSTGKYKFDSNSKDYFKMTLIEGGMCCDFANKEESITIQANRIK